MKVLELFAGVGGFRVGLEAASDEFKTLWANQYEPSRKSQDAFHVYNYHFPNSNNINKSITDITNEEFAQMDADLIVGGFPCLTGDVLVLTKKGYKRIDEIQVGDEVLTHRNRYRRVLNVFNQGIKDVVQVSGANFRTFKATPNHKFWVKRYIAKTNSYMDPDWWELKTIRPCDLLALSLDSGNPYQKVDWGWSLDDDEVGTIDNQPGLSRALIDGIVWVRPDSAINHSRGSEVVYDIEVEEDHSFTANNIVVHNCQNYSVASTSNHAKGIEGEKGVLFWDIVRAVEAINPQYLLLENVDRLLKSPSKQRGRDFGVILQTFNQLGYNIQWRVINAAEYGFPQKRKRVFLFVYRRDSGYAQKLNYNGYDELLKDKGLYAKTFPVKDEVYKNRKSEGLLPTDLVELSNTFKGDFYNNGCMIDGYYYSIESLPNYEGAYQTLGDIKVDEVDDAYYLDEDKVKKFQYLRGAKKFDRISKDGHKYTYSEGAISPYDAFDKPARTVLTSEGAINRTSHFLLDDMRYRLLHPVEAERAQTFPDDWTLYGKDEDGTTYQLGSKRRLFFMGNALVVGIVELLGKQLLEDS